MNKLTELIMFGINQAADDLCAAESVSQHISRLPLPPSLLYYQLIIVHQVAVAVHVEADPKELVTRARNQVSLVISVTTYTLVIIINELWHTHITSIINEQFKYTHRRIKDAQLVTR